MSGPLADVARPGSSRGRALRLPLLMYGLLFMIIGLALYTVGVLMGIPRVIFRLNDALLPLNAWIVWYSGVPLVIGVALATADLFLFFPRKRQRGGVRFDPVTAPRVTVALTAYNDEASIAAAVADFRTHPRVGTVIVVSNNSRDATLDRALEAGALAFNEKQQGYGYCVHRCLTEAARLGESDLIVLCEGDMTFRAYDVDKLLAYAPHGDVVNGTRTAETLRDRASAAGILGSTYYWTPKVQEAAFKLPPYIARYLPNQNRQGAA